MPSHHHDSLKKNLSGNSGFLRCDMLCIPECLIKTEREREMWRQGRREFLLWRNSVSIFTPVGVSGCYGIADRHRCHGAVHTERH